MEELLTITEVAKRLRVDDFWLGQEVTWNRKSPWTAIHAWIIHKYTTKVRIRFRIQSYDPMKNNHWSERDVSIRHLIPGHWTDRELIEMGLR